ncbi:phage portal protein [Streptomyces sp. H27-H1]|uniref:phage portal protein n=1 Tax=Streptomyces sp. H27-H1 TaxID=2996461 RepID=UPI00226EB9D1|nr:phage portal protein [Streptomyces sp. H27-H1]MCY0926895.1 phage portal protein [Streptomyces sp. H27-H1]
MSLFKRRSVAGPTAGELIPPRPAQRAGGVVVTDETALRHSAVWACLRLRANLVSTMPVDVYRRVGEMKVEVPKPPVLVNPGGERVGMMEWLYSTQFDLDRAGNCFGLITARDGLGLPARIELVPLADVTVRQRDGVITYRIGSQVYTADEVWHERQYTMAGLAVGLSPVAYAAWSIGEYLSVQQFALDWFGNGAVPSAHLKNTAKRPRR